MSLFMKHCTGMSGSDVPIHISLRMMYYVAMEEKPYVHTLLVHQHLLVPHALSQLHLLQRHQVYSTLHSPLHSDFV